MSKELSFGLLPHEEDPRDIKVGAVMNLPKLSELPDRFKIDIPRDWILKQSEDDCAGHASSLASSTQEGVRLDPKFTWVMARYMKGIKPEEWGVSLRNMMDAHRKIGAIELNDSPYKEEDKNWRNAEKWNIPAMLKKSVVYKKGSVIWVAPTQGYDTYDTIRALIWKYKTPLVIGMRWPYGQSSRLSNWQEGGYGHAVVIKGWDHRGNIEILFGDNSWGIEFGDNGEFQISREIINREVPKFGSALFLDEDPEKLKQHIANGVKLDDSWYRNIMISILTALKEAYIALIKAKTGSVPPYPIKVVRMSEAIKKHEGWYPGSRSYRNNNPANAKYIGQRYAVDVDDDGFAIFDTYEHGWDYLQRIVYNACAGYSKVYSPEMTLLEYFAKYAPSSDNNDPKRYAEVVAWYIGVPVETKLKDLIV